MGCFFSKKSRRKCPDREPALSDIEEDATNNIPATSTEVNATALSTNNTEEAPKQYSWDKRPKVLLTRLFVCLFIQQMVSQLFDNLIRPENTGVIAAKHWEQHSKCSLLSL